MTTYKRRLIPIVDKQFQFKYTFAIMAIAAVISTVLGWFLLDAYRELNSMIEISSEIGDQLNSDDARRVFFMVVGFLGAEVVILGVVGLMITHRVVGPVFVMQRHLQTLKEGRYPTFRPLRSGDEFRAAFETFSDVVRELRERDRAEAAQLSEAIAAGRAVGLGEPHLSALQGMVDARNARVGSGESVS